MSRLLLAAALLLLQINGAAAQSEPATTVFDVEGVQVIHRHVHEARTVAVRLYLLGGTRQLSDSTAGIEALLLRSAAWGTEGLVGDANRDAEMTTGSSIWVAPRPDWTEVGFDAVASEFGNAWEVLAERVARPAFDSTGIEIERRRAIASARSRDDTPNGQLSRMADGLAFRGHPYAHTPTGTEASLRAISVEALRSYHAEQILRSRIVVVVVGGVELVDVDAAVRSGLGGLPRGSYEWKPAPVWSCDEPDVIAVRRILPTNYILGYFAGPPASSRDFPAFEMAVGVLGSLVNTALRAEGLTYTASAPVIDNVASGGGIHITTRGPERSIKIVNEAIEFLHTGVLDRSLLQDVARDSQLEYWYLNETTSGMASFVGRTWLLTGEVLDLQAFIERWSDVEPHEVRGAARRYIENIRYAYLGSLADLPLDRMRRR